MFPRRRDVLYVGLLFSAAKIFEREAEVLMNNSASLNSRKMASSTRP
jgi:hypothetical protein